MHDASLVVTIIKKTEPLNENKRHQKSLREAVGDLNTTSEVFSQVVCKGVNYYFFSTVPKTRYFTDKESCWWSIVEKTRKDSESTFNPSPFNVG